MPLYSPQRALKTVGLTSAASLLFASTMLRSTMPALIAVTTGVLSLKAGVALASTTEKANGARSRDLAVCILIGGRKSNGLPILSRRNGS